MRIGQREEAPNPMAIFGPVGVNVDPSEPQDRLRAHGQKSKQSPSYHGGSDRKKKGRERRWNMYGSHIVTTGAATTTAGVGLAFTGAHVIGLVVLGVGLLFAGLSLLGLARRRPSHPRP